MSSAYLAISILKKSPIPENHLRIFLSHISQPALKEYLSKANIYKERNISKNDLIDMIISDKDKSKIYTSDDNDITQEANTVLDLIKSEELLLNTNREDYTQTLEIINE